MRAGFQPPYQFNALDTRSALKVDFWLLQPTPFDRSRFSRRQQVNLFGETAWISSAEDTVLQKLLWSRISPSERQIGDAAGILAVQRGTLDLEYLRRWAVDLGVQDVFNGLLSGKVRPNST